MYCKKCFYDLRGQQIERCPECGSSYDSSNPETYFASKPGWIKLQLLRIQHRRVAISIALTIVLLISWYIPGRYILRNQKYFHPSRISSVNLKIILTTWLIQQHEHPEKQQFDIQSARKDMRPFFSARTETKQAARKFFWRYLLVNNIDFTIPLLIYTFLLLILYKMTVYRFIVLVLLFVTVCLAEHYSSQITNTLWPGSYKFLGDYVYLPELDWKSSKPNKGNTIAAFGREKLKTGGRRVVGYMDGHVNHLFDEQFIPLLQRQGYDFDGDKLIVKD